MGLLNWLSGTSNSEVAGVKPAELLQQLQAGQKVNLVDVRERQELSGQWAALPGARNIPLSEFGQRFGEIAKDKPVILICRSGQRSMQAAQFLRQQGYTQIQNVEGGMLAVGMLKNK